MISHMDLNQTYKNGLVQGSENVCKNWNIDLLGMELSLNNFLKKPLIELKFGVLHLSASTVWIFIASELIGQQNMVNISQLA